MLRPRSILTRAANAGKNQGRRLILALLLFHPNQQGRPLAALGHEGAKLRLVELDLVAQARRRGHENLIERGIEGLCVIGGDGSLTGGSLLSKETGMPIVGLPGTIDNDVWGMDYTIGCDTACNTIVDAINKLRDTASAHRRIIIVEVMGRCRDLTARDIQNTLPRAFSPSQVARSYGRAYEAAIAQYSRSY